MHMSSLPNLKKYFRNKKWIPSWSKNLLIKTFKWISAWKKRRSSDYVEVNFLTINSRERYFNTRKILCLIIAEFHSTLVVSMQFTSKCFVATTVLLFIVICSVWFWLVFMLARYLHIFVTHKKRDLLKSVTTMNFDYFNALFIFKLLYNTIHFFLLMCSSMNFNNV